MMKAGKNIIACTYRVGWNFARILQSCRVMQLQRCERSQTNAITDLPSPQVEPPYTGVSCEPRTVISESVSALLKGSWTSRSAGLGA